MMPLRREGQTECRAAKKAFLGRDAMGFFREFRKKMVEESNDPAWSVLCERGEYLHCRKKAWELAKEGVPSLETKGQALAYLAWGALSAAQREESLISAPTTDKHALSSWFYEHREESSCLWRTQYRRGCPRMKVDSHRGTRGPDMLWRGGRWLVNIRGAEDVDKVQRAASGKYAELVLGWEDDPAREKYLRLMGISNNIVSEKMKEGQR